MTTTHREDAEFLRLWTEAASRPGYNKADFIRRQRELEARVYGPTSGRPVVSEPERKTAWERVLQALEDDDSIVV